MHHHSQAQKVEGHTVQSVFIPGRHLAQSIDEELVDVVVDEEVDGEEAHEHGDESGEEEDGAGEADMLGIPERDVDGHARVGLVEFYLEDGALFLAAPAAVEDGDLDEGEDHGEEPLDHEGAHERGADLVHPLPGGVRVGAVEEDVGAVVDAGDGEGEPVRHGLHPGLVREVHVDHQDGHAGVDVDGQAQGNHRRDPIVSDVLVPHQGVSEVHDQSESNVDEGNDHTEGGGVVEVVDEAGGGDHQVYAEVIEFLPHGPWLQIPVVIRHALARTDVLILLVRKHIIKLRVNELVVAGCGCKVVIALVLGGVAHDEGKHNEENYHQPK
mmetsp:Transcript_28558/g.27527  ORF Transcript_28558/g.27527 Transcript_28558/m.27527 type:complete len:326 (-) Transcript_28558:409-1386(-)